MNLYTIYPIVARALGLAAVQPLGRVRASKGILHTISELKRIRDPSYIVRYAYLTKSNDQLFYPAPSVITLITLIPILNNINLQQKMKVRGGSSHDDIIFTRMPQLLREAFLPYFMLGDLVVYKIPYRRARAWPSGF